MHAVVHVCACVKMCVAVRAFASLRFLESHQKQILFRRVLNIFGLNMGGLHVALSRMTAFENVKMGCLRFLAQYDAMFPVQVSTLHQGFSQIGVLENRLSSSSKINAGQTSRLT